MNMGVQFTATFQHR